GIVGPEWVPSSIRSGQERGRRAMRFVESPKTYILRRVTIGFAKDFGSARIFLVAIGFCPTFHSNADCRKGAGGSFDRCLAETGRGGLEPFLPGALPGDVRIRLSTRRFELRCRRGCLSGNLARSVPGDRPVRSGAR